MTVLVTDVNTFYIYLGFLAFLEVIQETFLSCTLHGLVKENNQNSDYLTIRLRAQVFYEHIVNEVQPT